MSSRELAPPDKFEECPNCGNEDIETWTETVEYGRPTNWQSRGAVAPKYKTKKARFFYCEDCRWSRP